MDAIQVVTPWLQASSLLHGAMSVFTSFPLCLIDLELCEVGGARGRICLLGRLPRLRVMAVLGIILE